MARRVNAILFDVFGTLVRPVATRGPYHRIAAASGVDPTVFRRDAMTLDKPISTLAAGYGVSHLSRHIERNLEAEVSGLQLFDDVQETLELLDILGIGYGLCSNLAQGYGAKALDLLPKAAGRAFSYEIGSVKPEREIYLAAAREMGVEPSRILFIGDSRIADEEGPRAVGMRSRRIHRAKGENLLSVVLGSLSDAVP